MVRLASTFGNGLSNAGDGRSVISGPNESSLLSPQPLVREGSSVAVHSPVASPRPRHGGPFFAGKPLSAPYMDVEILCLKTPRHTGLEPQAPIPP
jgi:hypothetical protein